ncbi:MAG: two pore domain potassium channel family protein [Nitrospiraceae bacterium]|jgi:voltage-gated potassium channel|nr:MAG: two pore domain potassium channel family protein [Nitrospiraceae bacterium]
MDNIRFRLQILLVLLLVLMLTSSVGFMKTEGLSFTDAIYFSIVTVTTVGYGDIIPKTEAGKIIALILIITGVGTFLGVVANSTEMLLNRREKGLRREKLNMVIGVFFSEVGTDLLKFFSSCDTSAEALRKDLVITNEWSDRDFTSKSEGLNRYNYATDSTLADLYEVRALLQEKRGVILRIFENPYLLEHQSFTELLRAVLHLKEELLHRKELSGLPAEDYKHLSGDIRRAYILLVHEWLDYMKYLRKNYPYLFSLAIRTNPFDRNASVIVK